MCTARIMGMVVHNRWQTGDKTGCYLFTVQILNWLWYCTNIKGDVVNNNLKFKLVYHQL